MTRSISLNKKIDKSERVAITDDKDMLKVEEVPFSTYVKGPKGM